MKKTLIVLLLTLTVLLLVPMGLAEAAGSEGIEIFDLNNKIRMMLPEGYSFQGRFSDTNNGRTVTAKVYTTTAAAYPAKISFTDTGWMTTNFDHIISYFSGLYGIERFTFEKGAVGDVSTALGIVYRPGDLCDVIFAYLPGGFEQKDYRMIYARDLNKTQVNGFLEILDGIVRIEPDKCGKDISWSLSEEGVLHLEGSGEMYEYAKSPWDAELVRSAVVDEGITSLSPYVFQNAANMTEVSLPSTITAIPDFAFHLCYSLEAIDFHPGIKTIGMYAFSACKAITELDFPSSIEDVGTGAFSGCASLVRVRFSEGLKILGGSTFQNCRKLVDVTLPSTLESLCAQAFYDCRGLRTIKLPDSLKRIESAFINCTALTEIVIPARVTEIDYRCFDGCVSLKKIILPDGLEKIGERVFRGCSALAAIDLPSALSSIGKYAFQNCTSLATIDLPSALSGISAGVFEGCTGLREIKLPDQLMYLGDSCFNECTNLAKVCVSMKFG